MRYEKSDNAAKLTHRVRLKRANIEESVMPISEQLLEILVCPACRAKVELKPDGQRLEMRRVQACLSDSR